MVVGVLIAMGFFALSLSAPIIIKMLAPKQEAEVVQEVNLDLMKLPPPPIDPKTPPPPPPPKVKIEQVKVAMQKFLPPKVVEDEKVVDEPPTVDDLKDKAIGANTQEGVKGAENVLEVVEGTGTGPAVVEAPKEEVFLIVEQSAEFAGGMAGFYKYVAEHIRYPNEAKNNDVTGRVIVEFIIGSDGSVRDARVVKGIGYGCDEEALRVIKGMPKWSPGKQQGRAVSQKLTVPIKFTLSN